MQRRIYLMYFKEQDNPIAAFDSPEAGYRWLESDYEFYISPDKVYFDYIYDYGDGS